MRLGLLVLLVAGCTKPAAPEKAPPAPHVEYAHTPEAVKIVEGRTWSMQHPLELDSTWRFWRLQSHTPAEQAALQDLFEHPPLIVAGPSSFPRNRNQDGTLRWPREEMLEALTVDAPTAERLPFWRGLEKRPDFEPAFQVDVMRALLLSDDPADRASYFEHLGRDPAWQHAGLEAAMPVADSLWPGKDEPKRRSIAIELLRTSESDAVKNRCRCFLAGERMRECLEP